MPWDERRCSFLTVGRTLSRSNRLGQLTQYAYNARNELTKMTDPLGAKTTLAKY
jgi:YD repeat-containing protein